MIGLIWLQAISILPLLRIAGDLFIVQPAIRKEKELINDTIIAPLFLFLFG